VDRYTPQLPVISTLTGKRAEALDADYWLRQLVAPVAFTAAVREARRAGANIFIELGGSNGLTTCGKLIAARDGIDHVWCALVAKSPDGELSTADPLATLLDVGLEVRLPKADSLPGERGNPDRLLPRYVGNRRPHWLPIASGSPAERDPKIVIRASDAVVANHLVDGIAAVPFCWLVEQVARALAGRRDDALQFGRASASSIIQAGRRRGMPTESVDGIGR
jgi:acyl transferase domain-containing protein